MHNLEQLAAGKRAEPYCTVNLSVSSPFQPYKDCKTFALVKEFVMEEKTDPNQTPLRNLLVIQGSSVEAEKARDV